MHNLQGLLDKILSDIRKGRSNFDRTDALVVAGAIKTLQFYGSEENYENNRVTIDKGSLARVELM